jgi:hypothetical protein
LRKLIHLNEESAFTKAATREHLLKIKMPGELLEKVGTIERSTCRNFPDQQRHYRSRA